MSAPRPPHTASAGCFRSAPVPSELLKFTLDDSPLIAAAVVATAVPVPQQAAALSAPRQVTKGGAIMLLGAIFSMIVAFNLAFFRHLRREYASPR